MHLKDNEWRASVHIGLITIIPLTWRPVPDSLLLLAHQLLTGLKNTGNQRKEKEKEKREEREKGSVHSSRPLRSFYIHLPLFHLDFS